MKSALIPLVVLACALIADSCAPTATTAANGRKRRSVGAAGNDLAIIDVVTNYPYSSDKDQVQQKLEQLTSQLANNLDSSATNSFNPSFNGIQNIDGKLGIQLLVGSSQEENVDCDQLVAVTQKAVRSVQGLSKATIKCNGQNHVVNKV